MIDCATMPLVLTSDDGLPWLHTALARPLLESPAALSVHLTPGVYNPRSGNDTARHRGGNATTQRQGGMHDIFSIPRPYGGI